MTTDIVERLRERLREALAAEREACARVADHAGPVYSAASVIAATIRARPTTFREELIHEAADEIERLRERVAELEKECLDRGKLIKALSKP